MSKRWALAALVVFVVVDVILIASVLRRQSDSVVAATGEDLSPTSTATSAPATPDATATPEVVAAEPEALVFLAVARDNTVVRATRGACGSGEPAKFDFSSNTGKSFATRTIPVTQVLALRADSGGAISLVGTDATCTPVGYTSPDGGQSWQQALTPAGWYFGPEGIKSVVSPTLTSKPGCDVLNMSAINDLLARVTCTSGTVMGSGDGGKKWTLVGTLTDVRAAVFPAPGNGMALAKFQGCAAQTFTTRNGGRDWTAAGCITGEKAEAIAFNGTTLIAQVSGEIYTSTNKGTSWSQP
ncbi:hypothetical protein BH09ACT10_BH09ACT10_22640 [soil metagenome]